jgi:hypothetical protein
VKVVLDTNVLVSGILFTGPPHQILSAWSDGRFELVFTRIYTKNTVVLLQNSQFPRVDLAAALDLVLVNAHAFPSVTPAAFGEDRGVWALALAQTYGLRGDAAQTHGRKRSTRSSR